MLWNGRIKGFEGVDFAEARVSAPAFFLLASPDVCGGARRADIPVRSNVPITSQRVRVGRGPGSFVRCCGQECPRAGVEAADFGFLTSLSLDF